MDSNHEREKIREQINTLKALITTSKRQIYKLEDAYAEALIAEYEDEWRERWRIVCNLKGWQDAEKPIFWNSEHGAFCAGGRAMNDTEYDIDKAVAAVYDFLDRNILVEANVTET